MELATLIERYQDRFIRQYGHRLTRDQRRALTAMLACRTAQCGEILLDCPACHDAQTRYRSCGHRSCPRCQHHDTARWLERQRQKLLPVEYFLVTFTLPGELRALARRHPVLIYGLLFACAHSTLATFAGNADKWGGTHRDDGGVAHAHPAVGLPSACASGRAGRRSEPPAAAVEDVAR
ncbi:MAG: transposase zinc-binding domain-containing protein [Halioglobus sp.]|nr:transposase zinc-binding domain-containing protein [Halioglobus sp.]